MFLGQMINEKGTEIHTKGAFHLHQNSDKSHFCLSSTFMLKKDRSEIYLSFDVNGKHLLYIHLVAILYRKNSRNIL